MAVEGLRPNATGSVVKSTTLCGNDRFITVFALLVKLLISFLFALLVTAMSSRL